MSSDDSAPPIANSPAARYKEDLSAGKLLPDDGQANAVRELEALFQQICEPASKKTTRLFSRFFNNKSDTEDSKNRCGLYIWGPVGRGKSYLVDTFYDCLPFKNKKRIHFHSFMRAIHHELKSYPNEQDPLRLVAKKWAGEIRTLCLDEFHVGDITDAMILAKLLEELFSNGVIILTTSNDKPSELYNGGLQRQRFLPAIDLIENKLKVIQLAGPIDYRLRALEQAKVYYSPHSAAVTKELKDRFASIAGGFDEGGSIQIEGREIATVARADGAVWFEFSELCDGPRSVADYIEIALCHHTLFLSNIPYLDNDANDAARRFINLIDELYDRNVNLIVSAAAGPESLYSGSRLEKFFRRTISRLKEMQSHEYLARPHISE
ncbi:MAG: cell division protein ZapE [Gammaproteobacteria bacterium]